jgi:hypothetical protein
MPQSKPYLHPSKRVLSIERAMPRTQTRGEHPHCDFKGCPIPADFTFEIGDDSGSGHVDVCTAHLELELQNPQFSAKVLAALINKLLP